MNKNYLHVGVAVTLTFFLLALADFLPFWMPMMGELVACVLVTLLLIVWTGFVMKEDAQDERELYLQMRAGRVAYLSGLGFLTIALIVQVFFQTVDPWIAMALAVMVLAKLFTRLYLE